ncbi:MAG TPA: polyprenyl synthetase family protein [Candidatus Cloacimonadota bacterium]|nr:polyprenyl synthetase family protein [Candidatus Cloacimonadota bacterium]
MTNKMQLKKDLKEKRELVNITLDRFLPRKDEYPKEVHKAIRHSLFAGGKRLRPFLCIRTFSLFNDNIEKVRNIAAAIELLHTYTLIHDDLPDIDDDEYRRGRKACHVLYGNDIALLAGDALLVSAFELLSHAPVDDALKQQMIKEMAIECGDRGLIAGQMMDILCEKKEINERTLNFIHKNKTGKLINMAIRFGCLTAGATNADIKRMNEYGTRIGLAFQIVDDILDIEGDQATVGKTIGKDAKVKKATYPSIYGVDRSREMAKKLIDEATALLSHYGEKAEILLMLTDYMLTRQF